MFLADTVIVSDSKVDVLTEQCSKDFGKIVYYLQSEAGQANQEQPVVEPMEVVPTTTEKKLRNAADRDEKDSKKYWIFGADVFFW